MYFARTVQLASTITPTRKSKAKKSNCTNNIETLISQRFIFSSLTLKISLLQHFFPEVQRDQRGCQGNEREDRCKRGQVVLLSHGKRAYRQALNILMISNFLRGVVDLRKFTEQI